MFAESLPLPNSSVMSPDGRLSQLEPNQPSIVNLLPQKLRDDLAWRAFATFLCFLFGLAFILNIHPMGDGLWFWYADLFRSGHKLYADMHLSLQPLFVLLTAWCQTIFGLGWLASKILALANLIAYCLPLYLLSRRVPWENWQRAILLFAAFFFSLTCSYSRFDDYHITGYCFELWTIYLLLRCNSENVLRTSAVVGLLSGLAIANRLNDGATLLVPAAIVLSSLPVRRRLLALVILCCTAPLTLLGVILISGDSLHDWAMNSIIHAAAIKGGSASMFAAPVIYPLRVSLAVRHTLGIQINLACLILVALISVAMKKYARQANGKWSAWKIAVGVGSAIAALILTRHLYPYRDPMEATAYVGVLVGYLLGLLLVSLWLWMFLRPNRAPWGPQTLLLLVPICQMGGSTLTTRGAPYVLEIYPQAAFLFLLLPICFAPWAQGRFKKTIYLTLAIVLAVPVAILKTGEPYHWHHFVDTTLFQDRQWYQHPVYGPMYIETPQLRVMQQMCSTINTQGAPTELLSITNPYPNYFCSVPPWHGYVQTWYDTTSQQTIDQLIGELQSSPPKWIIYQRSLTTLAQNEAEYSVGHPLPHRALDALIMDRLASQRWKTADFHDFEGAQWLVINTRP